MSRAVATKKKRHMRSSTICFAKNPKLLIFREKMEKEDLKDLNRKYGKVIYNAVFGMF